MDLAVAMLVMGDMQVCCNVNEIAEQSATRTAASEWNNVVALAG
jgi:hypothetical protein